MYETQYGQHGIAKLKFETMAEFSTLKLTGGTASTATDDLPQIITTLPEVMLVEKLGYVMSRASWYRFKAIKDNI